MDLAAVRAGLANALSTIPDLQRNPYILSNPTTPYAQVVPGEVQYHLSMYPGFDQLNMKVQLFVGLVTDQGAQVNLDKYLAGSGSLSVKQALEADGTLGGISDDVTVTQASGYQAQQMPDGSALLMCEWDVQVIGHT